MFYKLVLIPLRHCWLVQVNQTTYLIKTATNQFIIADFNGVSFCKVSYSIKDTNNLSIAVWLKSAFQWPIFSRIRNRNSYHFVLLLPFCHCGFTERLRPCRTLAGDLPRDLPRGLDIVGTAFAVWDCRPWNGCFLTPSCYWYQNKVLICKVSPCIIYCLSLGRNTLINANPNI